MCAFSAAQLLKPKKKIMKTAIVDTIHTLKEVVKSQHTDEVFPP